MINHYKVVCLTVVVVMMMMRSLSHFSFSVKPRAVNDLILVIVVEWRQSTNKLRFSVERERERERTDGYELNWG